MGKKIYVYEGFSGKCFITDKRVNEDWIVCCSSVPLAESFVDAVGEDFGVFEIYYLPHKHTDDNGNDFYVTEVGYSFDC